MEAMRAVARNVKKTSEGEGCETTIGYCNQFVSILNQLTELHRKIKDIAPGSIIFTIMCPTLESLDDLHELCTSDQLSHMISDACLTEEYRDKGVAVSATIDEEEWQHCRTELQQTGEILHARMHYHYID